MGIRDLFTFSESGWEQDCLSPHGPLEGIQAFARIPLLLGGTGCLTCPGGFRMCKTTAEVLERQQKAAAESDRRLLCNPPLSLQAGTTSSSGAASPRLRTLHPVEEHNATHFPL